MSLGKGVKPKNRLAENVAATTIKTIICESNFTDTFLQVWSRDTNLITHLFIQSSTISVPNSGYLNMFNIQPKELIKILRPHGRSHGRTNSGCDTIEKLFTIVTPYVLESLAKIKSSTIRDSSFCLIVHAFYKQQKSRTWLVFNNRNLEHGRPSITEI